MAGKQISQQRPSVKPEQINDLVKSTEQDFSNIVSAMNSRMNFAQEALYAYQAMLGNSYLASVAMNNKASFALAMQQIASSGLTLNPAMGLAFLVPREGKVIADISYRGLMKIATDSRAVDLVVACSVYSRDTFSYNGANDEPIHVYDPFLAKHDRGEFRGVYVKAYLSIGKLLVHPVSAEDVYAARQLSSAWANTDPSKKKGPWDTHFDSMAIKTGIKIARKYWPMTSPALDNVISYLNEEGGEGFVGGAVTLETASREMHGPSSVTQTNVVNLHEGVVYDVDPNPVVQPQADASPVGDPSKLTAEFVATFNRLRFEEWQQQVLIMLRQPEKYADYTPKHFPVYVGASYDKSEGWVRMHAFEEIRSLAGIPEHIAIDPTVFH